MSDKFHDYEYLQLVKNVLDCGVQKGDRTGTGTLSLFAQQMRFDLSDNSIPLLTTKKMFTRGIIYEILWYLQGNTNIGYLTENNVHIWDQWANEDGELGAIYGKQWRQWQQTKILRTDPANTTHHPGTNATTYINAKIQTNTIDQIANVIDQLRNNPNDRRIIVNAWNVGELDDMALPPCHAMFQFWVNDGKLSCHLYQRSCDIGLGVPFNIVQYSILTHMIAHVTGLQAAEFVWTGGDCHIYNNHVEQMKKQLLREPHSSPTIELNDQVSNIDDFKYEDFKIVGYDNYWPTIKMDVSV